MAIEIKENPTGLAVLFDTMGKTREKNTKAYIQEGYRKNVIIFRCIDEIAKALGSVTIEVHGKDGPIDNHPALSILNKPNPTQSWPQFIRNLFTDYLITGNMFATRYPDGMKPIELWAQPPEKMEVIGGKQGLPSMYVYKGANKTIEFQVDQITGRSTVFHMKTYNPENPFVGMSPLEPISTAADLHNNGLRWNAALLENSARPSGIMTFDAGMEVSNEAAAAVKNWFRRKFQGPKNAGEVHVVKGGKWQSLSENAKDMDFLNSMKESSKYIASALGVPLPLVDNDAASYNNIQQAKERFWTDTVLPLLNEFLTAFGSWLLPAYGEGLKLAYDVDSIPALEELRARRFTRMSAACGAPMLTVDEARAAVGYEQIGGISSELLLPTSSIPVGAGSVDGNTPTDSIISPVGTGGDVQSLVLNGAQISSLQQIVQAVADGMLPGDTAAALIAVAFPALTESQISKIIKPAQNFTPTPADNLKSLGFSDEEIKLLRTEIYDK